MPPSRLFPATMAQELWVEPVHYMGMDMAAIDVKDLLKAAPIDAPTRQELTASAIASSKVCFLGELFVTFSLSNAVLGRFPQGTIRNYTIRIRGDLLTWQCETDSIIRHVFKASRYTVLDSTVHRCAKNLK